MESLKGSKTEQNLLKAFAGESQARMRYDYFAKQARAEGLEYIASIFDETAVNEREHAKRFFDFLEGGPVEISAAYPAGKVGDTLENLKAAAEGENEEWTELYPQFAEVAEEEGFKKIAGVFKNIAKVEKAHEERYDKLHKDLEAGRIFEKEEKVIWKCRKCGYLHESAKAPKTCPICLHPQAYFEQKTDSF